MFGLGRWPTGNGRSRWTRQSRSSVTATAEHREPCDSRGSCTVLLGAPGGEIPPGDSTGCPYGGELATGRYRLTSPVPVRPDEGLLIEPTPAGQPCRRNGSLCPRIAVGMPIATISLSGHGCRRRAESCPRCPAICHPMPPQKVIPPGGCFRKLAAPSTEFRPTTRDPRPHGRASMRRQLRRGW